MDVRIPYTRIVYPPRSLAFRMAGVRFSSTASMRPIPDSDKKVRRYSEYRNTTPRQILKPLMDLYAPNTGFEFDPIEVEFRLYRKPDGFLLRWYRKAKSWLP